MLPETDLVSTLLEMTNHSSQEEETEVRLARTLLENLGHIGQMKNKELAKLCYVDSATISRFVRKLGFSSYRDFREWFLMDEKRKQHLGYFDLGQIHDADEILSHHLTSLKTTGEMIPLAYIEQLVDWMMAARNVLLNGNRYSQLVCQDLQYRLVSMNRYVATFQNMDVQEHYLEESEPGLMICYSASLHHRDAGYFIKKAKEKGWRVALITRKEHELAKLCDLVIYYASPLSQWTINSVEDRLCMLYINDLLTYVYVKKLQKLQ